MLNFIYYPVSFILWCWHQVFGAVLGDSSGVAWALAVVFLVFTLRALLYKPFVSQVRSMRKMQELAPEMKRIREKYGKDRQKLTAEMQKLQSQEGFNPLGGCLPILVQVPVFIGLFQVLRQFQPGDQENYFFDAQGVASFVDADLFGAKLGSWVMQGDATLRQFGTSVPQMLYVMIPLMIAAGVFTHITARHSVARQAQLQVANQQTAVMNNLMLYVFPIGVVVGAPFMPLAVLIYWVANNLWTLAQQYVVYRRIDAEDTVKREQATATAQALAPRPGQKPVRPERGEATQPPGSGKTPGAKPVARKATASPAANGRGDGVGPAENGAAANGTSSGERPAEGAATPDAAGAGAAPGGANGADSSSDAGGARRRPAGGSAHPSARRGRRRR